MNNISKMIDMKLFDKPVKPKNKFQQFLSKIHRFVFEHITYPVQKFFRRYYQNSKRAYDYAKFGWKTWEYDYSEIYSLMAFKLKRLQASMENGYHFQVKEDMDALKESIKLCHRIKRENYEEVYLRELDKKWGKSKMVEKEKTEKGTVWTFERKNVKTSKDRKKHTNEFVKCYKRAEKAREADMDRLAYLLKKYSQRWWT